MLTWTGNLAIGAAVTITYTVTVASPDTGDQTLANTVTSSDAGSTCPPSGPGAACTATVTVLTPALTITKTASASQVVAGQNVSYTIVITNTGQVPYTPATITDPLSGVLSGAAYNADAAATTGTVSFASSTLSWSGDLPVSGTAVITYSVTTSAADANGTTLTNTVAAAAQGSNCGSGSTDPGCTATVSVLPQTIALTNLTSSFTLAGAPGTVAQQNGAVTMTVTTNSPAGYQVTVQPAGPALTSAGSADTIPFGDLGVRETGQAIFQSLGVPVLLRDQSGPSAPGGDPVSNDYEITVPTVQSGTYTGTLEYIATATP